ncbi:hypothetical protein D9M68_655130 [compost metagenome]
MPKRCPLTVPQPGAMIQWEAMPRPSRGTLLESVPPLSYMIPRGVESMFFTARM